VKHWFLLMAATVAFTAFAPASQAQVRVDVPGVGVRGAPDREGSARQNGMPLGERAGDRTGWKFADGDAAEVRLG
jgi:hypothetical protein